MRNSFCASIGVKCIHGYGIGISPKIGMSWIYRAIIGFPCPITKIPSPFHNQSNVRSGEVEISGISKTG